MRFARVIILVLAMLISIPLLTDTAVDMTGDYGATFMNSVAKGYAENDQWNNV